MYVFRVASQKNRTTPLSSLVEEPRAKSQESRAKSQEPRASERGDAPELEKKQRVVRPEGRPGVRATEVCVKRQCHVRLKCVRLETDSRALELCAVGDRTTSA